MHLEKINYWYYRDVTLYTFNLRILLRECTGTSDVDADRFLAAKSKMETLLLNELNFH